jgi:hypothetical protein
MFRCEPAQATLEDDDVEVHEEADRETGEAEVSHDLRFVNGKKAFDGLPLEKNPVLHDDVKPVTAVHQEPFVLDAKRALALEPETSERELGAKTRLVGRFEESRTEGAMDFDESSDDYLRPFPKSPDLPISLCHAHPVVRPLAEVARSRSNSETKGFFRVKTARTKFHGALGFAMLSALSSIQIPAKADPPSPAVAPVAPSSALPPQVLPDAPTPPAVPVLLPEPSAPVALPSPESALHVPTPASGVSRRTVALGAAGVAAVGAVSAVVFGILALQNKSDYAKAATYTNTDNGNNFAAYTDGCIALAAAAGITSLVLYFTSSRSVEDAARPSKKAALLSAAPIVTMHGGGVGTLLRF